MVITIIIYLMYSYAVIFFDKKSLMVVLVIDIMLNALLAEILCIEKPNFGAANVISKWIKFVIPGLISRYDILLLYQ